MSFETKKLREQRAKVTADQRAMFEAAEKENRGLNAEEQAKSAEYDAAFASFTERVTRLEALEEREMAAAVAKEETALADHGAEITEETRSLAFQGWALRGTRVGISDRHREAMQRVGMNHASDEICINTLTGPSYGEFRDRQSRAAMGLTANVGGYTIPQGFVYNLEAALLQFGGPRKVADVFRTSAGNDMPWPTVNDTGNKGALLAESTTISTSVAPTVGSHTFKAYKFSSTPIMVSYELLQDTAFDLGAEIGKWVGIRIGRIECDHYTGDGSTVGTGSSMPQGIVTGSTTGVTTASATAFTADELVNLLHSVDPAYRSSPSFGWMMRDTALSYIRKFKQGSGQYLWQPGLGMGVPDTLLGYPITINQSMDTVTSGTTPVTGKKHVIVGDFSKYKIRDVAEVRLVKLVERYADLDQVAFIAFHRTDAAVLDAGTHPISILLQA